jgi:hypothetical protein
LYPHPKHFVVCIKLEIFFILICKIGRGNEPCDRWSYKGNALKDMKENYGYSGTNEISKRESCLKFGG